MKKGFTLIELLVVIGIIGILVGVMLGTMTGVSDSARAAKCLAHLHDLASACQTVAMDTSHFPLAGSMEIGKITVQKSSSGTVSETKGWVSWASMGVYRNSPKGHKANSGFFISTYDTTVEKRIYALTNGAIWQAISGNAATFVCPHHKKCVSHKKVEPVWSYVMNSAFGWDSSQGREISYSSSSNPGTSFRHLAKMDRRLLLAELPFDSENADQKCSYSTGTGIGLDPTLQYEENETIGFNHKSGKKWYAHVCFADGHTEKLELPKGAGTTQIQKLTKWLCTGTDITYNGTSYEELQ